MDQDLQPPDPDAEERARLLANAEAASLAPAFREHPAIRLAYLHAVLGNISGSLTVLEAEEYLRDTYEIIDLCGTLPTLPKPAKSLVTAKRRLGLAVDDYIERIPICTVCFKPYTQDEIDSMDGPDCVSPRCQGIVYRIKHLLAPSGEARASQMQVAKRIPAKIQPYTSPILALRRMCLRRDFIESLRDASGDLNRLPLPDNSLMHDFHDAKAWGSFRVGMKRVVDEECNVSDEEILPGTGKSLLECDLGLSFTLNVDWFGITENRPHSCGGVYITCNNLHRSVRYLQQNIILVTTVPGPKEPSLEQLNYVFAPLVRDMKILGTGTIYLSASLSVSQVSSGVVMLAYSRAIPPRVHAGFELHVSDIQASRKVTGSAAHSHKAHPCNICLIEHDGINLPAGYDIANFVLRDDWKQLKAGFKSKNATSAKTRKEVLDATGSRHTELNEIPGWLPVNGSALDYMHNFFGMVEAFFSEVLIKGCLLDAGGWRTLQDCVNSIVWPSTIGRLPTNLGENRTLQKCDQLRRWCNIQSTVLWICWRGHTDKIGRRAPPIPSQNKNPPTFKRDLQRIYTLILYLSVAERILAAKAISMEEVRRGQRYLQQYCQGLLALGVNLVPNHHMSMHYTQMFERFGPAYAWWLFAFERCNGEQEDVNLNGHAFGEMELTLIRNWIGKHRLFELRGTLRTATEPERRLINRLMTKQGIQRGTLRTHIAGFTGGTRILQPKAAKRYTDIRKLPHANIYPLLLEYARSQWPQLNVVDDFTALPNSTPLIGSQCIKTLPFIYKEGIRYGSSVDLRSRADRFACVDFESGGRTPCHLLYHFVLATDLGIYTVYQEKYTEIEIISSQQLAAAVALIPVTLNSPPDVNIWIVHSLDRTGIEPIDDWLDNAEQELEDEGPN
ncbi:hypothetical protein B0H21DRAFT_878742 [Amylocystis lapponica]|nr:hypothetical protein B0H21DRAFT_878742 [Amylocystis lapponica]